MEFIVDNISIQFNSNSDDSKPVLNETVIAQDQGSKFIYNANIKLRSMESAFKKWELYKDQTSLVNITLAIGRVRGFLEATKLIELTDNQTCRVNELYEIIDKRFKAIL